MWAAIIQNAALSILSIVLVQYLWDYFRDKYTVRKTKDLVNFQTKKYREMLESVQETATAEPANPKPEDDYISPEEKQRMVEELMSFIAW